MSDQCALIDFSNSADGIGPENFLADHYYYFTLVQLTSCRNEAEWNFENSKTIDFKSIFPMVQQLKYILLRYWMKLNSNNNRILERIPKLQRIRVLLIQSIENSIHWERYRLLATSANLVLPVANILWHEFNVGRFHSIETCRNIFNLNRFFLQGSKFKRTRFYHKLLRICINHSNLSFEWCWV